jgi:hypothetical protein
MRATSSALFPISSLHPQQQQQAERLPPPLRVTASPPTSCSLHRAPFSNCPCLTLRPSPLHLVLPLAATNVKVSGRIGRLRPRRCSRHRGFHRQPLSTLASLFLARAPRPPPPAGAHACLLGPRRGPHWPPRRRQRHRSAIPAGELSPELPRLRKLAHGMRLGAGSALVPSSSPRSHQRRACRRSAAALARPTGEWV